MDRVVVANAKAGGLAGQDAKAKYVYLDTLFKDAGIPAEIRIVHPAEMTETLNNLKQSGIQTLFVGGGDGTLGSAAGILADSDVTMGMLPLGTFNLFTKDLGIPSALPEAVAALAQGETKVIDIGEVNGQVFLNKVVMGFYPHAIEQRKMLQAQWGLPKRMASIYALLTSIWRSPTLELHIKSDSGEETLLKTPFVMLGNNRYEAQPLDFPKRNAFDEGHLSVYYSDEAHDRLTLFMIGLRALLGRSFTETPELEKIWTPAIEITKKRRHIKLAIDGELIQMSPPLNIQVRPKALKTIIPKLG
ncbi:MAG: diacylglycerol kinase family protein [Pseudomonadota bacterium]